MLATPLQTERLDLEPLDVTHAEEMVGVLSDPALYAVTGGSPPSLPELRERYRRQVAGPPDGGETWLNWVARRREDGAPVGFVQATVLGGSADLAWLVGAEHQGRGYAAEAASAMVDALAAGGVRVLSAYVAPGHVASEAVARRLGLAPTSETVDGEVLWERRLDGRAPPVTRAR